MKKQILAGLVVIFGLSYLLGTSKTGEEKRREAVSKSVVYITDKAKKTGGTGFHIKGPSGQRYLLTNGHVCDIGKESGIVYVRFGENDDPIPRRIIEESKYTDLCLVEPMPSSTISELAEKNPTPASSLKAIGHPKLLPLTITNGLMIGYKEVKVFLGLDPQPGTCDEPKHEKTQVPVFIFTVPACVLKVNAIATTIPILPGSSGSPILNSNGEIAGIAFAGDSDSNWAWVIPVSDIKKFIEKY